MEKQQFFVHELEHLGAYPVAKSLKAIDLEQAKKIVDRHFPRTDTIVEISRTIDPRGNVVVNAVARRYQGEWYNLEEQGENRGK